MSHKALASIWQASVLRGAVHHDIGVQGLKSVAG
jgi:hypothetical protein